MRQLVWLLFVLLLSGFASGAATVILPPSGPDAPDVKPPGGCSDCVAGTICTSAGPPASCQAAETADLATVPPALINSQISAIPPKKLEDSLGDIQDLSQLSSPEAQEALRQAFQKRYGIPVTIDASAGRVRVVNDRLFRQGSSIDLPSLKDNREIRSLELTTVQDGAGSQLVARYSLKTGYYFDVVGQFNLVAADNYGLVIDGINARFAAANGYYGVIDNYVTSRNVLLSLAGSEEISGDANFFRNPDSSLDRSRPVKLSGTNSWVCVDDKAKCMRNHPLNDWTSTESGPGSADWMVTEACFRCSEDEVSGLSERLLEGLIYGYTSWTRQPNAQGIVSDSLNMRGYGISKFGDAIIEGSHLNVDFTVNDDSDTSGVMFRFLDSKLGRDDKAVGRVVSYGRSLDLQFESDGNVHAKERNFQTETAVPLTSQGFVNSLLFGSGDILPAAVTHFGDSSAIKKLEAEIRTTPLEARSADVKAYISQSRPDLLGQPLTAAQSAELDREFLKAYLGYEYAADFLKRQPTLEEAYHYGESVLSGLSGSQKADDSKKPVVFNHQTSKVLPSGTMVKFENFYFMTPDSVVTGQGDIDFNSALRQKYEREVMQRALKDSSFLALAPEERDSYIQSAVSQYEPLISLASRMNEQRLVVEYVENSGNVVGVQELKTSVKDVGDKRQLAYAQLEHLQTVQEGMEEVLLQLQQGKSLVDIREKASGKVEAAFGDPALNYQYNQELASRIISAGRSSIELNGHTFDITTKEGLASFLVYNNLDAARLFYGRGNFEDASSHSLNALQFSMSPEDFAEFLKVLRQNPGVFGKVASSPDGQSGFTAFSRDGYDYLVPDRIRLMVQQGRLNQDILKQYMDNKAAVESKNLLVSNPEKALDFILPNEYWEVAANLAFASKPTAVVVSAGGKVMLRKTVLKLSEEVGRLGFSGVIGFDLPRGALSGNALRAAVKASDEDAPRLSRGSFPVLDPAAATGCITCRPDQVLDSSNPAFALQTEPRDKGLFERLLDLVRGRKSPVAPPEAPGAPDDLTLFKFLDEEQVVPHPIDPPARPGSIDEVVQASQRRVPEAQDPAYVASVRSMLGRSEEDISFMLDKYIGTNIKPQVAAVVRDERMWQQVLEHLKIPPTDVQKVGFEELNPGTFSRPIKVTVSGQGFSKDFVFKLPRDSYVDPEVTERQFRYMAGMARATDERGERAVMQRVLADPLYYDLGYRGPSAIVPEEFVPGKLAGWAERYYEPAALVHSLGSLDGRLWAASRQLENGVETGFVTVDNSAANIIVAESENGEVVAKYIDSDINRNHVIMGNLEDLVIYSIHTKSQRNWQRRIQPDDLDDFLSGMLEHLGDRDSALRSFAKAADTLEQEALKVESEQWRSEMREAAGRIRAFVKREAASVRGVSGLGGGAPAKAGRPLTNREVADIVKLEIPQAAEHPHLVRLVANAQTEIDAFYQELAAKMGGEYFPAESSDIRQQILEVKPQFEFAFRAGTPDKMSATVTYVNAELPGMLVVGTSSGRSSGRILGENQGFIVKGPNGKSEDTVRLYRGVIEYAAEQQLPVIIRKRYATAEDIEGFVRGWIDIGTLLRNHPDRVSLVSKYEKIARENPEWSKLEVAFKAFHSYCRENFVGSLDCSGSIFVSGSEKSSVAEMYSLSSRTGIIYGTEGSRGIRGVLILDVPKSRTFEPSSAIVNYNSDTRSETAIIGAVDHAWVRGFVPSEGLESNAAGFQQRITIAEKIIDELDSASDPLGAAISVMLANSGLSRALERNIGTNIRSQVESVLSDSGAWSQVLWHLAVEPGDVARIDVQELTSGFYKNPFKVELFLRNGESRSFVFKLPRDSYVDPELTERQFRHMKDLDGSGVMQKVIGGQPVYVDLGGDLGRRPIIFEEYVPGYTAEKALTVYGKRPVMVSLGDLDGRFWAASRSVEDGMVTGLVNKNNGLDDIIAEEKSGALVSRYVDSDVDFVSQGGIDELVIKGLFHKNFEWPRIMPDYIDAYLSAMLPHLGNRESALRAFISTADRIDSEALRPVNKDWKAGMQDAAGRIRKFATDRLEIKEFVAAERRAAKVVLLPGTPVNLPAKPAEVRDDAYALLGHLSRDSDAWKPVLAKLGVKPEDVLKVDVRTMAEGGTKIAYIVSLDLKSGERKSFVFKTSNGKNRILEGEYSALKKAEGFNVGPRQLTDSPIVAEIAGGKSVLLLEELVTGYSLDEAKLTVPPDELYRAMGELDARLFEAGKTSEYGRIRGFTYNDYRSANVRFYDDAGEGLVGKFVELDVSTSSIDDFFGANYLFSVPPENLNAYLKGSFSVLKDKRKALSSLAGLADYFSWKSSYMAENVAQIKKFVSEYAASEGITLPPRRQSIPSKAELREAVMGNTADPLAADIVARAYTDMYSARVKLASSFNGRYVLLDGNIIVDDAVETGGRLSDALKRADVKAKEYAETDKDAVVKVVPSVSYGEQNSPEKITVLLTFAEKATGKRYDDAFFGEVVLNNMAGYGAVESAGAKRGEVRLFMGIGGDPSQVQKAGIVAAGYATTDDIRRFMDGKAGIEELLGKHPEKESLVKRFHKVKEENPGLSDSEAAYMAFTRNCAWAGGCHASIFASASSDPQMSAFYEQFGGQKASWILVMDIPKREVLNAKEIGNFGESEMAVAGEISPQWIKGFVPRNVRYADMDTMLHAFDAQVTSGTTVVVASEGVVREVPFDAEKLTSKAQFMVYGENHKANIVGPPGTVYDIGDGVLLRPGEVFELSEEQYASLRKAAPYDLEVRGFGVSMPITEAEYRAIIASGKFETLVDSGDYVVYVTEGLELPGGRRLSAGSGDRIWVGLGEYISVMTKGIRPNLESVSNGVTMALNSHEYALLKVRNYFHEGAWINSPKFSDYKEGWKIHVTAAQDDIAMLEDALLPYLRQKRITHKVMIASQVPKYRGTTQEGKVVAVFLGSGPDAERIVEEMDSLIAAELKNSGKLAREELPYGGKSGMISYRYANHKGYSIVNPDNPDEKVFDDVIRETGCIPPWIKFDLKGKANTNPCPVA
ncbi:MAG: hypothetical protein HY544_05220 [Candidatus Diapherotrites archaeon]|uniref:RamC N-terminal domain-containing protein n=1 Tax=Candidatus Iainarchaeum sp. TaxID=3101447 RepID=A0A8T3YME3_9ARCH|nr:hypothetical protein [Candidatus Diapherotrites archaeon]